MSPGPAPAPIARLPRPAGGADRPAAAVVLPAGAGPAGADHPRRGGRPAQRAAGAAARLHPEDRPQVAARAGPPPPRTWPARGRRPARPGAGHRRRLGRCPALGRARRPSPPSRSSRSSTSPAARPSSSGDPSTAWTPRELADEAVKQGIVATHLAPLGGAFFEARPISSRIAAATGSTPRPRLRTPPPSPRRWRPSAPSTPTRRCWRRWAATSSAPTR